MRILLIEDDRFYAQMISEKLQDKGIEVKVVQTAQDALAEDSLAYNGAIADVMLPNDPEISGITDEESRAGLFTGVCVLRRLLKRNPGLRVILLTSAMSGSDAEAWASNQSVSLIRKDEGIDSLWRALRRLGIEGSDPSPISFIVHGHDEGALLQLKDYIQNVLKWREPIVLREQPNAGKTIIEKFEDCASALDCVFVLLTPDDTPIAGKSNDQRRRSRQNVIFEMGYFCGALGRLSRRVILLHKGCVELPSDIQGVVWIDISNGVKAAGEEIRNEIKSL